MRESEYLQTENTSPDQHIDTARRKMADGKELTPNDMKWILLDMLVRKKSRLEQEYR